MAEQTRPQSGKEEAPMPEEILSEQIGTILETFEKIIKTKFSSKELAIAQDAVQTLARIMWEFSQIWDLHLLGSVLIGAGREFNRQLETHYLHTMPYADYLLTKHWQKMRSEALERALHRCQVCYSTTSLHVHHRTYERRGNELPEDLIVLCQSCHQLFHDNGKLQVEE